MSSHTLLCEEPTGLVPNTQYVFRKYLLNLWTFLKEPIIHRLNNLFWELSSLLSVEEIILIPNLNKQIIQQTQN